MSPPNSMQLGLDCGAVRPAALPEHRDPAPLAEGNGTQVATVEDPASEADEAGDESGSDAKSDTPPNRPAVQMDYLQLLDREHTDQHVLGIIRMCSTSWATNIAAMFQDIDTAGAERQLVMSCEVLRRYTREYREARDGMDLPPLWQIWFNKVVSRLEENSTLSAQWPSALGAQDPEEADGHALHADDREGREPYGRPEVHDPEKEEGLTLPAADDHPEPGRHEPLASRPRGWILDANGGRRLTNAECSIRPHKNG